MHKHYSMIRKAEYIYNLVVEICYASRVLKFSVVIYYLWFI